tara:strand:- start:2681 stop:3130 length:450 start_codon:yes stop_codon:yes gene_type:complete
LIEGVIITPLKQFFDERGKVMHMMKNNSPQFKKFGEIYFSCTNPNAIKAWHLHKKMTLNYAVVSGSIKCVLYDDRSDSPTKGLIEEYFMSPEDYFLLTVPPLIWNGWKSIGNNISIVANCSDIPHDPDEIERKAIENSDIKYDWGIKHK